MNELELAEHIVAETLEWEGITGLAKQAIYGYIGPIDEAFFKEGVRSTIKELAIAEIKKVAIRKYSQAIPLDKIEEYKDVSEYWDLAIYCLGAQDLVSARSAFEVALYFAFQLADAKHEQEMLFLLNGCH